MRGFKYDTSTCMQFKMDQKVEKSKNNTNISCN